MQTIICKVDIEMVGENGKVEKKKGLKTIWEALYRFMGHKDEQGDQNVDEGKWICMLQIKIWKSLEKNMLWNTKKLGCVIEAKYRVNTKFWWRNGHIFNNKTKLNIKMRLLG
jgi:hypothetical protein